MRIIRLADLLLNKYKLALNADELEASIRKQIVPLWNLPNQNFNILKACAESGASKPKNADEQKAVAGYKFCKELVGLIDYLKNNQYELTIVDVREVLLNIVNLIQENKEAKFNDAGKISDKGESSNVQFSHVSSLIFALFPIKKKHDVKLRNDYYGKARTGLSRILSLCNSMLEEIARLEVADPLRFKANSNFTYTDPDQELPNRFKPQRTEISKYDILDFIRNHGDEYGLQSTKDWELAFRNDPALKEKITTVINALNRGHAPLDGYEVKTQIEEILKQHKPLF